MTTFLAAMAFCLALLAAWLHVRRLAAIDRASAMWRVALDFIAEEECAMPHEFAACFVAGNRAALDRKFPGWRAFAERRLAEWEAE